VAETSEWVPESQFMFLSLDTCLDPYVDQILTTTVSNKPFGPELVTCVGYHYVMDSVKVSL